MKECCKTYLNEQFGDDEAVVNEIYGEYVSSVRVKIMEATTALTGSTWQQLDRVAHTVKGNALAAGDNEMADVAIQLRNAAQLQDAAQARELIARLGELEKLL
ncbi:MAG: Hpt domain-containing protein [Kiritimatiellae bacterium]|nr:Hpt domain-containing protein [Kiritimatiellia bacterium]